MMYYTHLAFGLLVALLAINIFDINDKILFVLIAILFSIFPDIDERRSKIGKRYKWTSAIINFIFGHRGFFHSIYIPLPLFFVISLINYEMGVSVLVGYFSHLFMDAITRQGIKPLYPLVSKKINGPIRTNSIYEILVFVIIILLILYLLFLYY